jgi:hypothetical protein
MFIYRSPLTFQLWTYFLGHRQMLIRAQVFDENRFVKNVDIFFSGVTTISIPTTFNGIEIALKKPSPNGYGDATLSLLDLKTNKEHFLLVEDIYVEENYCENKSTLLLSILYNDEEYKEAHEKWSKSNCCLVKYCFCK